MLYSCLIDVKLPEDVYKVSKPVRVLMGSMRKHIYF